MAQEVPAHWRQRKNTQEAVVGDRPAVTLDDVCTYPMVLIVTPNALLITSEIKSTEQDRYNLNLCWISSLGKKNRGEGDGGGECVGAGGRGGG